MRNTIIFAKREFPPNDRLIDIFLNYFVQLFREYEITSRSNCLRVIIRIVVATIPNFVAVYRRMQRAVDAISSRRQPHSDIITKDAKHYLQRCVCRYSFMVPCECIGSVLVRQCACSAG